MNLYVDKLKKKLIWTFAISAENTSYFIWIKIKCWTQKHLNENVSLWIEASCFVFVMIFFFSIHFTVSLLHSKKTMRNSVKILILLLHWTWTFNVFRVHMRRRKLFPACLHYRIDLVMSMSEFKRSVDGWMNFIINILAICSSTHMIFFYFCSFIRCICFKMEIRSTCDILSVWIGFVSICLDFK